MAETKPEQLTAVFVYGTLKQGFSNHAFLKEHCHTRQDAITAGKFLMFTNYSYPAVVRDCTQVRSKEAGQILGEVYKVSTSTLERLDKLKEHPTLFQRQLEAVYIDGLEGKTKVVQMYFQAETEMTMRVLPEPETNTITFNNEVN